MNRNELVKLIDMLTKASNFEKTLSIPDDDVKKLKQFAKESNAHVKDVFDLLWARLSAKNPLVRIGVMILLDVLFMRSAYLRQLTVGSMAELLTLSVGSNRGRPLPPPAQHAGRLRQFALTALERWTEQFGNCYPQLATARSFVADTLRLELPSVAQQRDADAARRRAEGTQRLLQAKYEQLSSNADTKLSELELLLAEIDNCFAMLVPDVEELATVDGRPLSDAFQDSSSSRHTSAVDVNDDDEDNDDEQRDEITAFDRIVNGTSVVRHNLASVSSNNRATSAKAATNKRKFIASSSSSTATTTTIPTTSKTIEQSLSLNDTAPSLMAFVPKTTTVAKRATSIVDVRSDVVVEDEANYMPRLARTQFSDSLNALSTAKLKQTLQVQRSSSAPAQLTSSSNNVQQQQVTTSKSTHNDDDEDDEEVDEEGRSLNATRNVLTSEIIVNILNEKPLVKESVDNAVLFASIRERLTPLLKFLSGVGVAWETVLTKIVADEQKVQQTQRDALLHRVVNCKNSIRRMIAQCNELGIATNGNASTTSTSMNSTVVSNTTDTTVRLATNNNAVANNDNNNDDDDDFNADWEEGTRKDGYEAVVAQTNIVVSARPLRDLPVVDAEPPLVVASYDVNDDTPSALKNTSASSTTTTKTTISITGDDDEPPPTYVPHWAQKSPKAGAVYKNVSREQLRKLAPVVEPQACVLNWTTDAVNVSSVNRQHRFLGEADAPDLVVTSAIDPAAHLYVSFVDGSDDVVSSKRRKVD